MVRVGNNRPDLGVNPICNRFTGVIEEGRPLFLPCNPPMPGIFFILLNDGAKQNRFPYLLKVGPFSWMKTWMNYKN